MFVMAVFGSSFATAAVPVATATLRDSQCTPHKRRWLSTSLKHQRRPMPHPRPSWSTSRQHQRCPTLHRTRRRMRHARSRSVRGARSLGNFAPAPAVYVAPAPVVEFFSPAPAVSCAAPAPNVCVPHQRPARAVNYACPCNVCRTSPIWEHIFPAPAVSYAAPAPVVEFISPAPATSHAAPAHVVDCISPAPAACVPHQHQRWSTSVPRQLCAIVRCPDGCSNFWCWR